ncbi:hypothetical protein [Kitasatospora sp. P5_F3]
MTEYLMVESRHPFTDPGGGAFLRDTAALARLGHQVRLCLLQDGVLAAVARPADGLAEVLAAGVRVQADGYSLERHALRADDLPAEVGVCGPAELAGALLAEGVRVVWH